MKLYKPTKIEWVSFLTVMPCICVAQNYLMFGNRFLDADVLMISYPLIMIFGLAFWYLHVTLVSIVQAKYPDYSQTSRRTLILTSVHFGVITTSVTKDFLLFDLFKIAGYELEIEKLLWAIGVVMILTFIATLSWYTSYTYKQWKVSLEEKEKLQKENLQTEFESLKSQVNPHFLFNSLNSLSTLIDEDPPKAEKFLDEMSKVYRYLLRNNEDGLTTVASELQFIKSYYHLLKTRYNDGIDMQIEVEDAFMNFLIPPLTLQLLVENAVKHNNILKESPLQILIGTTETGRLLVTNNLQKKKLKVNSTRVGLANIKNKYKLLNQPDVIIREDERDFSVIVPLIKSN